MKKIIVVLVTLTAFINLSAYALATELKEPITGYSDEFYQCMASAGDEADDKQMLYCQKQEVINLYREIDDDVKCITASPDLNSLNNSPDSLTGYIENWKKYMDSVCLYYQFAFDYIDGKKIATAQKSEYNYEYCRWIESMALVNRLHRMCNVILKKQNS